MSTTQENLLALIRDDLNKLSDPKLEVVPKEETILFLLNVFNKLKKTKDVQLVHVDKVGSTVESIVSSNPASIKEHYQFMVQTGHRDVTDKGVRGNAHYLAMDLFFIANQEPVAFIVDHSRSALHLTLKRALTKLNVQIIVVGVPTLPGEKKIVYQADSTHCPIFSLSHLENTCQDLQLPSQLLSVPAEQQEETGVLRCYWYQLPPHYLLYAQSLNLIFNHYIAPLKMTLNLPAESPIPLLQDPEFDIKFSKNLLIEQETGQVQNGAIEAYATKTATEALRMLDTPPTSKELLVMFYKDRYPLVYALLDSIKNEFVFNSMSEFVFAQAHIVEDCLRHTAFSRIFSHPAIHESITCGLIIPDQLFHRLTLTSGKRVPGEERVTCVHKNLKWLKTLLHQKEQLIRSCSTGAFMDLLFYPYLANLAKNTELLDLLFLDKISIQNVTQLTEQHFQTLETMSDQNDMLAYIQTATSVDAIKKRDNRCEDMVSLSDCQNGFFYTDSELSEKAAIGVMDTTLGM